MKLPIKIAFLLLLSYESSQCYAQLKNDARRDTVEKFDINKFESFKQKNTAADTLPDGSIVIYIENADMIQEQTIKSPNSPYSVYKQYFKHNLMLKREEEQFYGMPIGVTKEYDHNGHLINEINYNSIFKFSLANLAKEVLDKYHVDIFKDKNFGIAGHVENLKSPYYELHLYSGIKIHVLFIDGITGGMLSEAFTTIKK